MKKADKNKLIGIIAIIAVVVIFVKWTTPLAMVGSNLLLNPSFEQASANWNTAQSVASATFTYGESGRSGSAIAIEYLVWNGGYAYWYQRVEVDPTKTYMFSGWLKTDTGGAYFKIDFYDANGLYILNTSKFLQPTITTNTWIYGEREVGIPATAKYAHVMCVLDNWKGKAYFDDMLFAPLIEEVIPTPTSLPTTIPTATPIVTPSLVSQQIVVSDSVTFMPIVGATVKVIETGQSVFSDQDGYATFELQSGAIYHIEATANGYVARQIGIVAGSTSQRLPMEKIPIATPTVTPIPTPIPPEKSIIDLVEEFLRTDVGLVVVGSLLLGSGVVVYKRIKK